MSVLFSFFFMGFSFFGINLFDISFLFLIGYFFYLYINNKIRFFVKEKIFFCFFSIFILILILLNFNYRYVELSYKSFNFKLNEILENRGIDNLLSNGNLYRNVLIYIRYLLIPFYVKIGMCLSHTKEFNYVTIQRSLLIALIVNLIFSIPEFGVERITGTFSNTANLSLIGLIGFIYSKDNKLLLLLSLLTIVMSKTNSAFLCIFFILLFKKKEKKSSLVIFILFLIITIIASTKDVADFFIYIISYVLYSVSLKYRFMIWSAMLDIVIKNPISIFIGFGTFPLFCDNIYWWIFSGFGFLGCFVFFGYIYKLSNNKNNVFIIYIFFVQGFLFPGLIMPDFIHMIFILMGFNFEHFQIDFIGYKQI